MRAAPHVAGRPTPTDRPDRTAKVDLTAVVYELLDAHDETARLGAELIADLRWDAHLAYLRDLQRIAREALAHQEADR